MLKTKMVKLGVLARSVLTSATPTEEQEIPTPAESVHVAHQDTDQTSEYVNVLETQHVELPSDDIAMDTDEMVWSTDGEAGNQSLLKDQRIPNKVLDTSDKNKENREKCELKSTCGSAPLAKYRLEESGMKAKEAEKLSKGEDVNKFAIYGEVVGQQRRKRVLGMGCGVSGLDVFGSTSSQGCSKKCKEDQRIEKEKSDENDGIIDRAAMTWMMIKKLMVRKKISTVKMTMRVMGQTDDAVVDVQWRSAARSGVYSLYFFLC
ncbi:unnamed protein product [Linum tenue]|uniref:Uncharacterized protein n=1 Tax=Linum tenue TaxID=586396 RepID=A0AAV0PBP9_9ROSI|nr:unnamed protein product [Linum tenue]